MPQLTQDFVPWSANQGDLGDGHRELYEAAVGLFASDDAQPNIETVLRFLDGAIEFKRQPHKASIRGWVPPFNAAVDTYEDLLDAVRKYIKHAVGQIPPTPRIAYLEGLLDFQESGGPLDVFTLNYDRLVEAMCAARGVRFTTGFGDTWDPGLFSREDQVRVYKLHGSVDWYQVPGGGRPIFQGDETHFAFADEPASEVILYPAGTKDSYAEPYATLMSQFVGALRSAEFLVVVGYSFGDEHIQRTVLDQMSINRQLQVLILDPNAQFAIEALSTAAQGSGLSDRISGLWFPAGYALQNRLIRHRIREIKNVDVLLEHVRANRAGRDFTQAASQLIGLVLEAEKTDLANKQPAALSTVDGIEFAAEVGRLLLAYGRRDLMNLRVVDVPAGFPDGSAGKQAHAGAFHRVVLCWLMAEHLGREDEAALLASGIRAVINEWASTLAYRTPDGGLCWWPKIANPQEDDAQTLRRRQEDLTTATTALHVVPEIPRTKEVGRRLRNLRDGVRALHLVHKEIPVERSEEVVLPLGPAPFGREAAVRVPKGVYLETWLSGVPRGLAVLSNWSDGPLKVAPS